MTITLRTTKGSALTFTEHDDNFRETLDLRRAYIDQVTAGGTGDVMTADFSATVTLVNGVMVKVRVAEVNTVAGPTINVNSTGAKTITGISGTPIAIGGLPAGSIILLSYDSGLDSWVAMNSSSTDALTLNGQPGSYYTDWDNITNIPTPTDTVVAPVRRATSAEALAAVETDAFISPATLGAGAPTSSYVEDTSDTLTNLTVGKAYLVHVQGWTKDRGSSAGITGGGIAVVNGPTAGGTVLSNTGTKTSLDWPDGNAPMSGSLIVIPTSDTITGVIDRVAAGDTGTCNYMNAVRLN